MSKSGQPHSRKQGSVDGAGQLPHLVRIHATMHGFTPREQEATLPDGALADDAPRALGIRPEMVLVFRDDQPLPGDAPLRDGDRIRIVRVVSGGAA